MPATINPEQLKRVLAKAGYGAEVKRIQKADEQRRARDVKNILGTDAIRDRDIDAASLLFTTLGGELRPITLDDLEHFSEAARKLGNRFKGGITAEGVIKHSLKVDRDRANSEIKTSVVVKAQAGRLHFVTNAGPESKDVRHHVHVEFPGFKAYAASPTDPKKLAAAMVKSPLRFECDCGRFTFWYRFVATKGKFALGRLETGFPKIRNPKLVGVACKHSLRVMQAVLKDAGVRAKVAQMIAAGQSNSTKALTTTAAEARAEAAEQLRKSHHLKNQVETAKEALARRAKKPGAAVKAKARALAAAAKKAQAKMAAKVKASRQEAQDAMKKVMAAPMTKAMRDALIKKLMAMQTVD